MSAAALSDFPDAGRGMLAELLGREFRGTIGARDAQRLADRTGFSLDQLLIALLPVARGHAIAPISRFFVGGVARGATSGNLYFGFNLEFAGRPLNLVVHAEQSAVNNAWLNEEEAITDLALSAAPCGHCRQFLYELRSAGSLRILLPGSAGQVRATLLAELVPLPFGPGDLGHEGRLMAREHHRLRLVDDAPEDALHKVALAAACASYAPYTRAFAGACVRARSGAIYAGRYAENAAFSPTLSPLASALALWSLGSGARDPVVAAALVEMRSGLDQQTQARSILTSVAPEASFRVIYATPSD